jgi:DeoR/GlpR family transcriptional regulator of sugar metabolism
MTFSQDTPIQHRRRLVAQIVEDRGHVVMAELAAELGVSEMTIRRDVVELAKQGKVVSFHGGVRAPTLEPDTAPFGSRLTADAGIKERIASYAATLVADDAAIALDAGTTAAALANKLAVRGNLRVVTASVPVITALLNSDGVEVVALGGNLRRDTRSFIGPSVVAAARDLQVETAFIGAAGLSTRGAFDVTDLDAVVKRELIRVSHRVVLLADASKFGRRAMSRICDWDSVDILITDDRIDNGSLDTLLGRGVEVVQVSSEPY